MPHVRLRPRDPASSSSTGRAPARKRDLRHLTRGSARVHARPASARAGSSPAPGCRPSGAAPHTVVRPVRGTEHGTAPGPAARWLGIGRHRPRCGTCRDRDGHGIRPGSRAHGAHATSHRRAPRAMDTTPTHRNHLDVFPHTHLPPPTAVRCPRPSTGRRYRKTDPSTGPATLAHPSSASVATTGVEPTPMLPA